VESNPGAIQEFRGQHRFLSNFYPAPVYADGVLFPTVEHAYQAMKTIDQQERLRIAALPKPGDAKRAGKAPPLRDGWDGMKVRVMLELLRRKFRFHPELGRQLLATGDVELREGNT
jgi:ribA/ribD-fused uncharacterized protein